VPSSVSTLIIRDVITYPSEGETRFGKLHDLIYRPQQRINVREYRMGNQKLTIQRNRQHRSHKTKTNKTKTQHNIYRKCLSVTTEMDVHNNQNECENKVK
jgi:hypothetical protein